AEACCFGVADPVAGELVAAAICLAEGGRIEGAELAGWCRERIRRESVPERWFFLERLPRNARGKLNREAVRDACLAAVES
ncbi:MAG: AMP-binding enzyme, partial [Kiloniellales bacterium]